MEEEGEGEGEKRGALNFFFCLQIFFLVNSSTSLQIFEKLLFLFYFGLSEFGILISTSFFLIILCCGCVLLTSLHVCVGNLPICATWEVGSLGLMKVKNLIFEETVKLSPKDTYGGK